MDGVESEQRNNSLRDAISLFYSHSLFHSALPHIFVLCIMIITIVVLIVIPMLIIADATSARHIDTWRNPLLCERL